MRTPINVSQYIETTCAQHQDSVAVRGSSLAVGYYHDPKKTRASFTWKPLNSAYPEPISRTGDIACWNARGELLFRARKDSLIMLGEIVHAALHCGEALCNASAFMTRQPKKLSFSARLPSYRTRRPCADCSPQRCRATCWPTSLGM